MDIEIRVATVENKVENNRKDIERLYELVSELRALIMERANHAEQHADSRFMELKQYVDLRFKEQNEAIREIGAAVVELRRENSANFRLLIGMWATSMAAILGIAGKVFGFY